MKRVTLLVEWASSETDSDGDLRVAREGDFAFFPAGWVESVEDAPEPLPTTPGATFVGYGAKVANAHEPCKWMVVLDVDADGKPDPARITYISQRYQEWSPSEAERYGLVRLPDPDVTP